MDYKIMTYGFNLGQYNTFWLIKTINYDQYGLSFMKQCMSELMVMKENYETTTDRHIIPELYIIWDEEDENDIKWIRKRDFSDILSQYENTLHIQYNCKKSNEIKYYH